MSARRPSGLEVKHTAQQRGEPRLRQRLGEQVGQVLFRGAVHELDCLGFRELSNMMISDVDVLRSGARLGIVPDEQAALVVTK